MANEKETGIHFKIKTTGAEKALKEIDSLREELKELLKTAKKLAEAGGLEKYFAELDKIVAKSVAKINEGFDKVVAGGLSKEIDTSNFKKSFESLKNQVKEFIEIIPELGLREKAGILLDALFGTKEKVLAKAPGSLFKKELDSIAKASEESINRIRRAFESGGLRIEDIDIASADLEKLEARLKSVENLEGPVKAVSDKFSKLKSGVSSVTEATPELGKVFDRVFSSIAANTGAFKKAFERDSLDKLKDTLSSLKERASDLTNTFKDLTKINKTAFAFTETLSNIPQTINIGNTIENTKKLLESFKTSLAEFSTMALSSDAFKKKKEELLKITPDMFPTTPKDFASMEKWGKLTPFVLSKASDIERARELLNLTKNWIAENKKIADPALVTAMQKFRDGLDLAAHGLKQGQISIRNFALSTRLLINEIKDLIIWQARWYATKAIVFLPVEAMSNVTRGFLEFEQNLKNVQAIGGFTTKEMEKLKNVIFDTGKSLPISFSDSSKAMMDFAQAGLEANEVATLFPIAAKMIQPTAEKMDDAIKVLVPVMKSWRLEAEDMPVIANQVASAMALSILKVADLSTVFNYLASTASLSNLSVKETMTLVTALSNVGVKASTIGTGISNALTLFIRQDDKFRDELRKAGISIEQFKASAEKGLYDVIKLFAQSDIPIDVLFRGTEKRTGRVLASLATLSKEFDKIYEKIGDPRYLKEAPDISASGLLSQFKLIANSIAEVFYKVFDVLGNAIRPILKEINNNFKETTTSSAVLSSILKGIGVALGLLLLNNIREILSGIGKMILSFETVKTLVNSINLSLNITNLKFLGITAGLSGLIFLYELWKRKQIEVEKQVNEMNNALRQTHVEIQGKEKVEYDKESILSLAKDAKQAGDAIAEIDEKFKNLKKAGKAYTELPTIPAEGAGNTVPFLSDEAYKLMEERQKKLREFLKIAGEIIEKTRKKGEEEIKIPKVEEITPEQLKALRNSVKAITKTEEEKLNLSKQYGEETARASSRHFNTSLETANRFLRNSLRLFQLAKDEELAIMEKSFTKGEMRSIDFAKTRHRITKEMLTKELEETEKFLKKFEKGGELYKSYITDRENILNNTKNEKEKYDRLEELDKNFKSYREETEIKAKELKTKILVEELKEEIDNINERRKIFEQDLAHRTAMDTIFFENEANLRKETVNREMELLDFRRSEGLIKEDEFLRERIELLKKNYEIEKELVNKRTDLIIERLNKTAEEYGQESDKMIEETKKGMEEIYKLNTGLKESAEKLKTNVEAITVKLTREIHNVFRTGGALGVISLSFKKIATEYNDMAQNIYDATQNIAKGMENAFMDFFDFTSQGFLDFKKLVTSILTDIYKEAVRAMIVRPLVGGIMNFAAGFFESNLVTSPGHHAGGVVGETPTFIRTVPLATFINAPRAHLGLNTDEIPIIAQKGETILPRGFKQQPPNVIINIENKTGQQLSAKTGAPKVSPSEIIVPVVIDAINRNYMGLRDALGSR